MACLNRSAPSPPLALPRDYTCLSLSLDPAQASKSGACPIIVGVGSDPLLEQLPTRGRVGRGALADLLRGGEELAARARDLAHR